MVVTFYVIPCNSGTRCGNYEQESVPEKSAEFLMEFATNGANVLGKYNASGVSSDTLLKLEKSSK